MRRNNGAVRAIWRGAMAGIGGAACLLAGCGEPTAGGGGGGGTGGGPPVTITGLVAGPGEAPFAAWAPAFEKLHPQIQIGDETPGSHGPKPFTNGEVDFILSDAPPTGAQRITQASARHAEVLAVPLAVQAISPVYDVPGVTAALNFTPEVLAGIFLGTITHWNDPALAAANPGVALPNLEIVPVHRSDACGATARFTAFLTGASEDWKRKVGANSYVSWPVGVDAKGDEGVALVVGKTPGTIGYVGLHTAVAEHLTCGHVRNAAGKFVAADMASLSAAAAAAEGQPAGGWIVDPPGDGSYPLCAYVWLVLPDRLPGVGREKALSDFAVYALTDGQAELERMGYAPLPAQTAEGAINTVRAVNVE
ncbi:MAG: phosphate ABC transporter substrate-binding protein PstS [Planctomycetota bacterium]